MPAPVPGWLSRWATGALDIKERAIDKLVLSTGRIVACDPLVSLSGAKPFARSVKKGKYAVSIGTLEGDEIAFACVRFSKAKVASWELALVEGETPSDEARGYGVDSGTGCFVDEAAATKHNAEVDATYERIRTALRKRGIDPHDHAKWHEAFDAELEEAGGDLHSRLYEGKRDRTASSLVLDAKSGANVVAFKSGAGDGIYASFWGLDAKGNPAMLLTDFGLLDDDDDEDEDEEEDDEDWDDEELEAEIATLFASERPPAPPVASPLLPRVKEILARWEKGGKMELEEDCDRDALAESLLEHLVSLEGHRHLGAHLAEWLMERTEVADVFASDAELEEDLK
jgi:hypothetical protein